MSTILFTMGFFLLMALLMAIGVIAGRKPIKGSCGGMSAMTGGSGCSVCGGDADKCDGNTDTKAPDVMSAGFYEASPRKH